MCSNLYFHWYNTIFECFVMFICSGCETYLLVRSFVSRISAPLDHYRHHRKHNKNTKKFTSGGHFENSSELTPTFYLFCISLFIIRLSLQTNMKYILARYVWYPVWVKLWQMNYIFKLGGSYVLIWRILFALILRLIVCKRCKTYIAGC